MDSVIINGEEPKLLQLIVWFEARFQKNTKVTIQVGRRAPLIHNNYMPSNRVYFYDITARSQIPIIQITYNSLTFPIKLEDYPQNTTNSIRSQDSAVCFIYELMNETTRLQQKYWKIRQTEDRIARGEGLSNFVRAESQFLSIFEKDEEVEQIKAVQFEQQKMEKQISDQIMSLRKSRIDIKVIIVLIFLFLIAGYFAKIVQDNHMVELQPPQKPNKKRKQSKLQKQKKIRS